MAVLLCSMLLNLPHAGTHARAMVVCLEVAQAAEAAEVPQHVLVSLAWHESRLSRKAVSRRGATGPLQIMPFWVKRGRSAVQSGAAALAWWRGRAKNWRGAVAMYNAGRNPGARAFRFADRVLKLARSLRRKVRT